MNELLDRLRDKYQGAVITRNAYAFLSCGVVSDEEKREIVRRVSDGHDRGEYPYVVFYECVNDETILIQHKDLPFSGYVQGQKQLERLFA
jgi:hypothetical protein